MSVEVLAGTGQQPEFPQMAEGKGWSAPGVRILVTGVMLALAKTRLSYASEIAQAMLRQQQANAVVGRGRGSSTER